MGNSLSALAQAFPPKPQWSVDSIPDLSGKVVLVTGGNTGIGKETVKALLTHNAKVYLAARDASKGLKAIEDLKASTGGKEALFLKLDLADLRSVRQAAEEFLSKEQELHILFENAGVMSCPVSMLTEQKYDLQWGTNVLGHFHLRSLLLPALVRASTLEHKSRIVITSSSASYLTTGINWNAFNNKNGGETEREKLGPPGLYNQSKFANVVVARELARRYGDKLVVMSCNPGNLISNLQRYLPSFVKWFADRFILYPVPYGALTQLWGATAPECVDYNGKFLIPWARLGAPNPSTQDPELGEKVWTWLEGACDGY
ncbi:NAD-P-binding protein [Stereum hirsutum FP-91666 SS1]|uniref:NAD-P-binding protein n=1 Tax=Stereum hirsutum (strain FP-91666) TaxID=721885 RepID=UPI0004449471|nr:NAD-P-binding protein [Stereum hirsutum FP-91666 SS1]EIM81817.1 NAD-P-binding protein [Stereum hirsutum FP-91666 SS1]